MFQDNCLFLVLLAIPSPSPSLFVEARVQDLTVDHKRASQILSFFKISVNLIVSWKISSFNMTYFKDQFKIPI
ncbi:hypothetical protein AMTRI_Chr07g25550 [Amborella trichopoda]